MPQSRSSSADSRGSSAKSAGKSSNSSGSVLSRVLGSLRRSFRDDDDTANSKEDPNWANNYKITHHPDRPRQDKRTGLENRNSLYVLDQLRRIWKYNGKMTEMRRREKEARKITSAGGMGRLSILDEVRRDDEGGEHGAGPGNLKINQMPNFGRIASSPVIAGNGWQVGGEAQLYQYSFLNAPVNKPDRREEYRSRPVSSPVSISAASDKMTIRVGLELSPYREEGFGGLKMKPGRAEPGGYNHTYNDISPIPSAPPPAPKFSTPLPVQSHSTSPFLSSEQKEMARKRQRSTLSYSLQQPKSMATYQAPTEQPIPIDNMQAFSAREKALRKTIKPLRIDTDQDKTPSLVLISSPASEQASPVTPTDDAPTNRGIDPELVSTGLQTTKTCPMPLCDNPLLTTADRKQNLCAECRNDLQPRKSIFSRDRSANEVRATETLPSSPQKNKSGNSYVISRFNKDRSEFKLQPVPLSRKYSRRGPGSRSQKSATPLHDGRNEANGNSHIGFQLAGWGTGTSSSTHQPLLRKPSGPLLEPKTFRPPTRGKNIDGSAIGRRPSESRRRAKGVNVRSNSGRMLSSHRTHVEKRDTHRTTEPTPNGLPPRSSKHGKKQQHVEHQAVEWGASVPDDPTSADSNAREINKTSNPGARKMARIDEDIYREIDNIIDCYLRVPDAPESENERRKEEAIASYFAEVPLDVEMKIKGFI